MKTEKEIFEMLRSLEENKKWYGSHPMREVAIDTLRWVLSDGLEQLVEMDL